MTCVGKDRRYNQKLGKSCDLNLSSGNLLVFSDEFKNSQFGKLTLLKIETILDITGLEKS